MSAKELDDLLPQLRDKDPDVRSSAAGALGALGPDGIPAITPLYEACRDKDMHVRGEAVHSLWEIAGSFSNNNADAWPLLVAGVPTLISLLDDPWWDVRCSAMSVLKQMGSAAGPALPRLRALLTDDNLNFTEYPESWGLEAVIRIVRESATKAIEAITESQGNSG
jgi:HEAT repeat protein